MANLKDIRRRINSVKNTQKITRAMKLVATAKFARANTAVSAARPYGEAFDAMVHKVAAAAGGDVESPLLEVTEEKKILLVFLATDRGFCGSLNSNLYKAVDAFAVDKEDGGVTVDLIAWGKRARGFCKKMNGELIYDQEQILAKPDYGLAKELAEDIVERFSGYDAVYLGFMKFQSALAQEPTVKKLLPFGGADDDASSAVPNMIIEPSAKELLISLLEKAVSSAIFRAMLEAAASEHGSRMTAMDSATNNAGEVIKKLTIVYNRARQAAITNELIEITSGAESV